MAYAQKRGNRWTGYYRHAGKRLCAGTYATEAEAKYHALTFEKGGSNRPQKANLSLSKFVEEWLSTTDLMPITIKGYRSIMDRLILPRIGDQQVTQIFRREIIDLLSDLKAEGIGSATIAQVKACLGSAFSVLVSTGQVSSNPTHKIKIKVNHADISNIVDPEEFKSIVEHLPNEETKLFAKFLVLSGCRFGEATEIRVKDFNFKTGELFVQRRVSDLGASHSSRFLVIEGTKSGKKRSLTLSKSLLHEIKQYVIAKAIRKEDLLFPRTILPIATKIEPSLGTKSARPFELDGKQFQHGTLYAYTHGKCRCEDCRHAVRDHRRKAKPHQKQYQKPYQKRFIDHTSHLPRDVWRNTWNKAIAKSGIGWSPRTHDLRHANATQLLKSGVDLHEVKERLGHQSIKTTERYLHRLRHNKSEAGEFANDYLE